MASPSAVGQILMNWATTIQDEYPVTNKSDNNITLIVNNTEESEGKATPEEVALVLKYWSSRYRGDISILDDILDEKFSAKVTCERIVRTRDKEETLDFIETSEKIIYIQKLSLEIVKKRSGELKVLYHQDLTFPMVSRTSSGKQKWSVSGNHGSLQFSKLRMLVTFA